MGRAMSVKAYYPELGMSAPVKFGPWRLMFTFDDSVSYYAIENLPHGVISLWSTGLTDKNGREIFEGDILRHLNFETPEGHKEYLYHAVEWSEKYGGWFMRNVAAKTEHDGSVQMFVYKRQGSGEVIGNVWEHPELMEDGNE